MSHSTKNEFKVNSDVVISLEEYSAIVHDLDRSTQNNSKVEQSYPEKTTTDFRWFKGSNNRGIKRNLVS